MVPLGTKKKISWFVRTRNSLKRNLDKRVSKKKVTAIALAAIISAVGLHSSMRTIYGRSYLKRVPLVSRMVVRGKQTDFFFFKTHIL